MAYPTDENTRVAVGEVFIEKWPVLSVREVVAVPFTFTLTPAKEVSPLVTTPVMSCWPNIEETDNSEKSKKSSFC